MPSTPLPVAPTQTTLSTRENSARENSARENSVTPMITSVTTVTTEEAEEAVVAAIRLRGENAELRATTEWAQQRAQLAEGHNTVLGKNLADAQVPPFLW